MHPVYLLRSTGFAGNLGMPGTVTRNITEEIASLLINMEKEII